MSSKPSKLCAVLFAAVINLLLGTHVMAEQDIRLVLDHSMIATHTKAQGTPKAAVLLIHGWAGQMDEVGDLYKRLAAQLSEKGIASIRINIRGESELEETNYTLTSTFSSRLDDANTGLKFLQQTYPELPKGAVGFSLGASTLIALVGEHVHEFESIVLWSAAGNPSEVAKHLLTEDQRNKVLKNGSVVINDWAAITVTKQHLLGLNSADIFPPFAKYEGALLCIRGTHDTIENIDKKIIETASGTLKEYRHIGGANHIFDIFDNSTNYDERVLTYTVDWLNNTLNKQA